MLFNIQFEKNKPYKMVHDLVGKLVMLIVVFYGTGGEGNEMGITKETATCSVLANRLHNLERGMRLNSQHFQEIDTLKEGVDSLKDEIESLKLEHRFEIDVLKDNNRLEINKVRQELIQLKGDQADFTVKRAMYLPINSKKL